MNKLTLMEAIRLGISESTWWALTHTYEPNDVAFEKHVLFMDGRVIDDMAVVAKELRASSVFRTDYVQHGRAEDEIVQHIRREIPIERYPLKTSWLDYGVLRRAIVSHYTRAYTYTPPQQA